MSKESTISPPHTPPVLTLDNLCKGAAYELANDAFKKLAANIADPNTSSTQTRKVVLTIEAKPYKDRSGADISVKVDTKLAGIAAVDGTLFISRALGEYMAFTRDERQTELEFQAAEQAAGVAPGQKPS